jgi:predicted nucleotide-binding protein (sugar kinase/HSP70/actin superfamily)
VICVVPPHRQDLAVGTLVSVLRQAGVDGDTFPEPDTFTIELSDQVSSSSRCWPLAQTHSGLIITLKPNARSDDTAYSRKTRECTEAAPVSTDVLWRNWCW